MSVVSVTNIRYDHKGWNQEARWEILGKKNKGHGFKEVKSGALLAIHFLSIDSSSGRQDWSIGRRICWTSHILQKGRGMTPKDW